MKKFATVGTLCVCMFLSFVGSYAAQQINPGEENFYSVYDVKFYHIDITVDNQSAYFTAKTTILVQLLKDKPDSISFDLKKEITVDSVTINGINCTYGHSNDVLTVVPNKAYNISDYLSIVVYYGLHVDLPNEEAAVFNKKTITGARVTYSLTEPFTSKSWFPCKQDLRDKADSVYVFVTTDDSLKAGSNGLLSRVVNLPDHKVCYEWKSHYPIAFYLISFAVANYKEYDFKASTADGDSVFVQNYVYNDSTYFANNKSDVKETANLIKLFSQKFGPYPFKKEKYGQCDAPLGGGMEHQTMATIDGFDFDLVAHELTHQWFGDYVTCADWRDIWLNEGFASYGEYIAYKNLRSDSAAMSWMNWSHTMAKSYPKGTVYIPESSINDEKRIFNPGLTYRKGASIIHMIRYELQNDSLFFKVLRTYLKEYAFSTATGDDFRKVLDQVTGKDFTNFFNQWYYGAGYPIFSIKWGLRNDSLVIYSDQHGSAPGITDFFKTPIDFKVEYFGGDTTLHFHQDHSSEFFSVLFKHRAYAVIPDPDHWLLADFGSVRRIFPKGDSASFFLFPNPAHDQFYVENYDVGRPFQIRIYDLKGILRKELAGKDAFTDISVSDLESGSYRVVLTREDKSENFSLVKR